MIYLDWAASSAYTGTKLLHCRFDGTDGDTSFEDISEYARTLSSYTPSSGAAQLVLSDEQSKFGNTSLKILSRSPDPIFVSGPEWWRTNARPYTIAFWLYYKSAVSATINPSLTRWRTAAGTTTHDIFHYSTLPGIQYNDENLGDEMSPYTYTAMTWTHVEMTSDGTTVRLFVDGTSVFSTAATGPAISSEGEFWIAGQALPGVNASDGTEIYISEMLVLGDQALHTADFTPPTEPYA